MDLGTELSLEQYTRNMHVSCTTLPASLLRLAHACLQVLLIPRNFANLHLIVLAVRITHHPITDHEKCI